MSEVKRYFADLISAYDTVPVENIHDVQVVLATDYAALEAERDSLKNSLLAITTRHFAERWKQRASDKQLEQYLSSGIAQLEAERDALRKQLADSDAALREARANDMATMRTLADVRQQLSERDTTIERLESGIPRLQEQAYQARKQRDKLAGVLREAAGELRTDRNHGLRPKIDAALAEVE